MSFIQNLKKLADAANEARRKAYDEKERKALDDLRNRIITEITPALACDKLTAIANTGEYVATVYTVPYPGDDCWKIEKIMPSLRTQFPDRNLEYVCHYGNECRIRTSWD